jgi:hypothetical protein
MRPDAFILLVDEALCPSCGSPFERTTLLCPEQAGTPDILIERPGLWCRDCGCAALDPDSDDAPARRATPARAAA